MPSRKLKILAVDDEPFNLIMLEKSLSSRRYRVVCRLNAESALTLLRREAFDVVLLDVLMPGTDGFEMHRKMREFDQSTPVIFLTALVDAERRELSRELGGDSKAYYLSKSLDPAALEEKIAQAVAGGPPQNNNATGPPPAERSLAADVQNVLLPSWCILSGSLLLSALYRPHNQVSGDSFDAIRIADDKFLFFIGDIAGHGMQSALYMSAVEATLRLFASTWKENDLTPHKILTSLNDFFFRELGGGNYMTCIVAVVDFRRGRLACQSAGHPSLFCYSPSLNKVFQPCEPCRGGDIPVGWKRGYTYSAHETCEVSFSPDTVFLACTDGFLELRNAEDQPAALSAWEPLLSTIAGEADTVAFPFRLLQALQKLGYDQIGDDVCIVAFRKHRPTPDSLSLVYTLESHREDRIGDLFSEKVVHATDDEKLAFKTGLLVHEFLNNVLSHGLVESAPRSRSGIYLRLDVTPKAVNVEILDRGCSWDSRLLYRRDFDFFHRENGQLATSGRGLAMIGEIARRITHNRYCDLNDTFFSIEREEEK